MNITINRMMSILLILMFAVPLALFGASMVGSAEAAAGGNHQIDQQTQMTQLIFYTASISYQCTDEIGGFEKGFWADVGGTYWTDWEDYRENPNFDWSYLEDAGSDLECYGATSTLPLAEGLIAESLPNYQGWLNDQTGEYSRQYFEITEEGDGEIQIGPCIAYTQGEEGEDVVLLFAPPTEDAITTYREGSSSYTGEVEYHFSGALDWGSACDAPTGSVGSSTSGGPVITTIIMGEVPDINEANNNDLVERYQGVDGWSAFDSGFFDEDGPSNFDAPAYTLCEGTTGYVQSNPGPNDEEFEGPDYTPDNPPGDPNLVATEGLTGGDEEANIIHPYVVITNWEDDCHD